MKKPGQPRLFSHAEFRRKVCSRFGNILQMLAQRLPSSQGILAMSIKSHPGTFPCHPPQKVQTEKREKLLSSSGTQGQKEP